MPPSPAAPFVEVAVALPVDGTFTYAAPPELELVVGHAVVVPFGRQRVSGYVVALAHETRLRRVKPVARLLDEEPAFTLAQLEFCRWAADYYLAGLGEMLATALPRAYRARTRRVFTPTPAGLDAIATGGLDESVRMTVLREVAARPGRTRRGIGRRLDGEASADEAGRALDALVRAELVAVEEQSVQAPGHQVRTVHLAGAPDDLPRVPGARMRGVLTRLAEAGGSLDLAALVDQEGPGARPAVRRLEARGLVTTGEREDRTAADPLSFAPDQRPPPTLNADQEVAVAAIIASEAGTSLLHGVTGSGKTEVYLRVAAHVLAQGGQVLVLVPEIALTPLLVGRFAGRFGDRVAVLHSGLSAGDRLREWRRIRAGEAQVAVGARSCLFAPFSKLGLVIVDEEHDDSYKQDDGVRYHARDLAVLRAHQAGCPVVLGSATPSLESWQNAQIGRYRLLRLPERATARAVPRLELVDMRGRPGKEALAPELVRALTETLDAGGKAIVLYNRRGYAPVVECEGCGQTATCPSCGLGMVLHQRRGRIICHYCGFHRPFQSTCEACGDAVRVLGHGTERVEEALAEAFPDVGIARMDADTTGRRGSHQAILERFGAGDARLLVGTQLVAKGHDFPDVWVAAVVGVDHILTMPDFRSAERTWSLVTQLAGRAGRGERAGRVLVQTRHADHFVFQLLAEHGPDVDADAFYAEEARQRRVLGYPPFARLALVRVEGADRDVARRRAAEIARKARELAAEHRDPAQPRGIDVLGPVSAPLGRLVGRWRFQLVLRGRDVPRFRRWLAACRPMLRAAHKGGVRVITDIDPRNLL